jgi:hypothetical protein
MGPELDVTLKLVPPIETQTDAHIPAEHELTSIGQAPEPEMTWCRTRTGTNRYLLRSGDAVMAVLDVRPEPDESMEARTASNLWLLRTSGSAWRRVEVLEAESGRCVAGVKERWRGGAALDVSRGRSLTLEPSNFWHTEWTWKDQECRPLLRWQNWEQSWEPEGLKAPEAELLAVLSWALTLYAVRSGRAGASDDLIGE